MNKRINESTKYSSLSVNEPKKTSSPTSSRVSSLSRRSSFKDVDLNNLSNDERQHVMNVLKKDFEIKKTEETRLKYEIAFHLDQK